MAISANELRIGNRFIRELHTSRGMEYDHDFVLDENWMGKLFTQHTQLALQDLFPIPLTPEILEACGFMPDRSDGNFYKRGEQFFSPIYNRGKYYGLIKGCGKEFEYLHQLQNLYFALTGTELSFTKDSPPDRNLSHYGIYSH